MTVLALATLGDATQNNLFSICVAPSKVAKASSVATVTCRCQWHYCAKICQWKHSLSLNFQQAYLGHLMLSVQIEQHTLKM
jgi:hypothetical protein